MQASIGLLVLKFMEKLVGSIRGRLRLTHLLMLTDSASRKSYFESLTRTAYCIAELDEAAVERQRLANVRRYVAIVRDAFPDDVVTQRALIKKRLRDMDALHPDTKRRRPPSR